MGSARRTWAAQAAAAALQKRYVTSVFGQWRRWVAWRDWRVQSKAAEEGFWLTNVAAQARPLKNPSCRSINMKHSSLHLSQVHYAPVTFSKTQKCAHRYCLNGMRQPAAARAKGGRSPQPRSIAAPPRPPPPGSPGLAGQRRGARSAQRAQRSVPGWRAGQRPRRSPAGRAGRRRGARSASGTRALVQNWRAGRRRRRWISGGGGRKGGACGAQRATCWGPRGRAGRWRPRWPTGGCGPPGRLPHTSSCRCRRCPGVLHQALSYTTDSETASACEADIRAWPSLEFRFRLLMCAGMPHASAAPGRHGARVPPAAAVCARAWRPHWLSSSAGTWARHGRAGAARLLRAHDAGRCCTLRREPGSGGCGSLGPCRHLY